MSDNEDVSLKAHTVYDLAGLDYCVKCYRNALSQQAKEVDSRFAAYHRKAVKTYKKQLDEYLDMYVKFGNR